jgi:protein O-mannosyl-transferase
MGTLPQKISANPWLSAAFLVLFVLSAYSPILNSSFKVFYDADHIVGNPQVKSFHLDKIFSPSLFVAGAAYRPLTVTSHALEYQFFSLTPFFYYGFNILIHLLSALFVYALLYLLINNRPAAFLISLLFALHPAHWQAVSFLSGRADLLNAMFNILSLVTCILYMRRLNGWWMALSLLFFACALLARESREFFLAVFFFYFLCLATDEDKKGIRWFIFLPYVVITFLYMGLRRGFSGAAWPSVDWSEPWFRLLSALRAGAVEIQHLFMPGEVYFRRTVAVEQAPYDSMSWVALALVLIMAVSLVHFRRKLNGTVVFLLCWLIAGLWPVMQAAFAAGPGAGRLALHESFLYLAVVPMAALIVIFFRRLLHLSDAQSAMARPVVALAAAGFVTLFFLLTYKNTANAYNEVAILEETESLEPPSAPFQYSLGLLYAEKRAFGQAQYHFSKAIAIDPDFIEARLGLGKTHYTQGNFMEAAKVYEAISNPGKYRQVVAHNLGAVYNILTLNQEAVIQKNPQDINAYFSLGVFYGKMGDLNKAIESYQRVLDLDPENKAGLRTLSLKFQGMLYQEIGNPARAQENFERARL